MKTYKNFIHSLSINKTNQFFYNSDNDKMLSVFIEMFNTSNTEFRIYAGNLCNEITERKEYIEAMSNFIEKKGNLYILLNNFHEENVLTQNLYKRLAYYQSTGDYKIHIKSTNKILLYKKSEAHLAIGDDHSFRIETDITKRTAICNMYDQAFCEKLIEVYDTVFNDKENLEIDLVHIFNLNDDDTK